MTEAFTAGVVIFIKQFRTRWPWSIDVLESWLSMSLLPKSRRTSSQFSARHCSEHTYSDHSWRCLPQTGTKRRGEGILRMEDAGTSEEDDIDSQDSNTPIDHGHLARNCFINIFGEFRVQIPVLTKQIGVLFVVSLIHQGKCWVGFSLPWSI